jgi:two-component system NarL family sensor kinase
MQNSSYDIVIFLIVTSVLICALIAFIIGILYSYRKRQIQFEKNLANLKLNYEKNLLLTQIEIQEETFNHISREIHDNITLSLTLAKLNLHTLDREEEKVKSQKVENSIQLLTNSIAELSNISKSLNSETIINQGLLKALEMEIQRIRLSGAFSINLVVSGSPVFMESQKELIVFRIIQESFNNILKHSKAKLVSLELFYSHNNLSITVADDGIGFNTEKILSNGEAGLANIKKRTETLHGFMKMSSREGVGTSINFQIPF